MGERAVLFSAADRVGVIRLNRPQARNAIDPGFTEDLRDAAQRCAADETVRAVLIRAEGPSFTVGGDVAAMARIPPAELPALVNRGGTYFLPRLVGTRRAAELCFSQRVLSASEAAEWGLITRVVRDEDLTAEAESAARLLAAGPTRALGEIRTLLHRSPGAELGDQLRAESDALARTAATREGGHIAELWAELGQAGLLGVHLPAEYGGGGAGLAELTVVTEELAAHGLPLLIAVISPAICGSILAAHASAEMKASWLPGLADGTRRMAFALTEPDAGSNSRNVSTTARRAGAGWVITGGKYYISAADECEALLLVARDDSAQGGLSLFVVPTGAPGLTLQAIPTALVSPDRQFTVFLDDIAKLAAADAALAALDQAIQTHGGNGLALEYGLADLWFVTRLMRTAPVSREMVLNYLATHSLGLPQSY